MAISTKTITIPAEQQVDIERKFWANVHTPNPFDCWNWNGRKDKDGYGRFRFNSQDFYSHRVSWVLANGNIPNGLFICHHCDNPSCCNPEHLFIGTHLDNMFDMYSKGRGNRRFFSNSEVIEIRNLYENHNVLKSKIAYMFNASIDCINKIIKRETYKNI